MPDFLSHALRTLGEQVADITAISNAGNQLDHRLVLSKNKFKPIGILYIDEPLFIQFIGKADGITGADGIETEVVA